MAKLSDREIGEGMLKVLDERGWFQGGWWDQTQDYETAPVCVGGALRCALWGEPLSQLVSCVDDDRAFTRAWEKLSQQLIKDVLHENQRALGTASWNDQASTSEEDVRLLIKRTFLSERTP